MLGGAISTYSSWRWIFWVNVPIGIVGLWVSHLYLPHIAEEDVPPFDWAGFLLSAVGLSALVFALETAGREVVPLPATVAMAGLGIGLLMAYVRRTRDADRPLVDLKLMRIASFRLAIVGGSLFRIGVGALPFLVPLQLQIGFGRSALESGLTTFIGAVGSLFMKPIARIILGRYGFRSTLIVNGVLSGLLMALVGWVSASTPVLLVMAVLFMAGVMRSLEFTAINAVSYADLEAEIMSRATSFSSMAQQLSLSAGVAVAALILHLLAGADGSIRAADISVALVVVGLASGLAGFFFIRLPNLAGAEMLEGQGQASNG
jgi:MFS family permease